MSDDLAALRSRALVGVVAGLALAAGFFVLRGEGVGGGELRPVDFEKAAPEGSTGAARLGPPVGSSAVVVATAAPSASGPSEVVERRIPARSPCHFRLSEKGSHDIEPPAAWREGRKVLRTICTLRVRADLPPFEVVIESVPGEDRLGGMEIRGPGVEPERFEPDFYTALFGEEAIPIEMTDMNFDGYLDLHFARSSGTSGCTFDNYFLYKPADHGFGHFEENKSLAELCRAEPDRKRRLIEADGFYDGDSPALDGGLQKRGEPGLYRWEGEELVPVRK